MSYSVDYKMLCERMKEYSATRLEPSLATVKLLKIEALGPYYSKS